MTLCAGGPLPFPGKVDHVLGFRAAEVQYPVPRARGWNGRRFSAVSSSTAAASAGDTGWNRAPLTTGMIRSFEPAPNIIASSEWNWVARTTTEATAAKCADDASGT